MVKVIEDEWKCKRCGHRMKEHLMHENDCIDCECHAFLISDEDAETVKMLKGQYFTKHEKNPVKKFLMKLGLIK